MSLKLKKIESIIDKQSLKHHGVVVYHSNADVVLFDQHAETIDAEKLELT